jgi:hypothetical protein
LILENVGCGDAGREHAEQVKQIMEEAFDTVGVRPMVKTTTFD